MNTCKTKKRIPVVSTESLWWDAIGNIRALYDEENFKGQIDSDSARLARLVCDRIALEYVKLKNGS